MIDLISDMLKGDPDIASEMTAAKAFWDDFYQQHGNKSEDDLVGEVGGAQYKFETIFHPNRSRAKSMMVTTAVGSLYADDDGFSRTRGQAVKMLRAFSRSMCSTEIKNAGVRRAATLYGLTDDLGIKPYV